MFSRCHWLSTMTSQLIGRATFTGIIYIDICTNHCCHITSLVLDVNENALNEKLVSMRLLLAEASPLRVYLMWLCITYTYTLHQVFHKMNACIHISLPAVLKYNFVFTLALQNVRRLVQHQLSCNLNSHILERVLV